MPKISALVQAAAEPMDPTIFGAALTTGGATILLYVGAAVVAAIPVALAIIGIRRGLATFRGNAR